MRSALLCLLLCSPAAAALDLADPEAYGPPELRLSKIGQTLRKGYWNARIHAVHNLAPHGLEGLPFLEWAAEDADWQVRLTAVHYLGRLGPPGIPSLAAVLRREPCRHVRLSAVHWLGSMGPEAAPTLQQALKDESGMLRLMNRYWLTKIGTPAPPQEGFEAASEADAAKKEDLKRCLSSQVPGRARWAAGAPPEEEAPAEDEAPTARASAEPLPTLPPGPEPAAPKAALKPETLPALAKLPRARPLPPPPQPQPPPPGEEERYRELDALLSLEAEELPAPAPAAKRAGAERPAATRDPLDRLDEDLGLSPRPEGAPESFPAGGPGPAPRGSAAEAGLAGDAGTGRSAHDPLPQLLAGLADADARRRWRCADELGKLGARAEEAVKPLAKALKDPEPRVRASAALALGNIGAAADRTVKALVKALRDPHEEVQLNAALALGRMGTARSRKAFRRHLKEQAEATVRPGR